MKNNRELYIQKSCSAWEFNQGKNITVGIHGVKGCFTDEAIFRFAQEELHLKPNSYQVVELTHAKNVIQSVITGKVDRGIFAVSNSGSGAYLASIEAMAINNFKVVALFTMPIDMCIISHKSIKKISQIKQFQGHPVAVAQCRRTLKKRWPMIPVRPDTDEMDTALSAQLLQKGEILPTSAVFASRKAAQLYDLTILKESVHDDPLNATSFVIIKKQ